MQHGYAFTYAPMPLRRFSIWCQIRFSFRRRSFVQESGLLIGSRGSVSAASDGVAAGAGWYVGVGAHPGPTRQMNPSGALILHSGSSTSSGPSPQAQPERIREGELLPLTTFFSRQCEYIR